VLKSVLAILRNRRKDDGEGPHIVAEVRDARHLPVLRMVGKGRVRPVIAAELIARVTVQASRQAGLSLVWTDLLDFDGHELYVHKEPQLVGKTFADALARYDEAIPIGVRRPDGSVVFNPPPSLRLGADDALVVLAIDDGAITPSEQQAPGVEADAIAAVPPAPPVPERTIILGWSDAGPTLLAQLGRHAAPGSTVTVVSSRRPVEAGVVDVGALTVEHRSAITTDRAVLEALELTSYQHVIVLPEQGLSPNDADARTLVTLLHLRDMAEHGDAPYNVVSELRDVRNRDLAEESRADDYIVSDRLVSLMLAQASESADMTASALLEAPDVDLRLRPASDYVVQGRPVTFATVRGAAEARGELALGYFIHGDRDEGRAAVRLSPARSTAITFAARDLVVVLAGRSA